MPAICLIPKPCCLATGVGVSANRVGPDAVNGHFQVYREAGATFNEGAIMNVQCQACPDGTASTTGLPGCDYSL